MEQLIISSEMLFTNLFLWDCCAKRRYSIPTTLASYIAFRLLLILFDTSYLAGTSLFSNETFTLFRGLFYIIPIAFLYRTRILKLINIFFFLWIYSFSLYCIGFFISTGFPIKQQSFILLVVQSGLYLLTFYIYQKRIITPYAYTIDHIAPSEELPFTVFSCIGFATLIFIYLYYIYKRNIVFLILFFISFFIVVVLFSSIIHRLVTTKIQMNHIEANFNFQMERYKSTKQYLKDMSSLIHDVNKYNAVIRYSLKEKNYDFLENYCDLVFQQVEDQYVFASTGNETLDALLYYLRGQCNEQNTKLDIDINIKSPILLDALRLTTIFGNLTENALEATKLASNDKWIKVKIYLDDGMLYIIVHNSKSGIQTKKKRDRFKKHLPQHIGLLSVEKAIADLGGFMTIDDTEHTYTVSVALSNHDTSNTPVLHH